MAASAASVSRRRKPPPSTNACGSSPTGVQPSSAIRSLAKLKTIEKADEKEAQRWASSLMGNALNRFTLYIHDQDDLARIVNSVARQLGTSSLPKCPSELDFNETL